MKVKRKAERKGLVPLIAFLFRQNVFVLILIYTESKVLLLLTNCSLTIVFTFLKKHILAL